MSSLRNLRRLTTYSNHPLRPRISTITTSSIRLRPFSQTSLTGYPRKGFEDRDSINAEATEYSKSGTDNAAAEEEEAAFDPSKTDPKEELKTAGKGNEETNANPLDMSPANPEVSKPRGEKEGGSENSASGKRQSGAGSPNKAKKLE